MRKSIKEVLGDFTIWEKMAFIVSFVIFFFVAVTAYYMDLRSLTTWSVNFWETLFCEKNLFLFWEYTAQNVHGAPHTYMGCDILVCIPWALWNLPLWILQHFGEVSVLEHPMMLLYSKLFLFVLLYGCIKVISDIGKIFTSDKKHVYRCSMIFGTGFFVLNSVGFYGQNDILIILLMLLAIRFVLLDKWKLFLLLSAISIAFEPYFIFSYVAIILLKEKRIHYILLYLVSGLSIFVFQKVPFWNAPMYQESIAQGPTKAIINMMFENAISITPYMVSAFLVFLFGVYLVAYFDEGTENANVKVLYYGLAAICCFFLFVRFESYRPLYLFSFVSLIMLIKPQFYRINLLIEFVSTVCLMIFFVYQNKYFFSANWLELPGANADAMVLYDFVKEYLPVIKPHICMSVYLLCVLLLLIINNPRFKGRSKVLHMEPEPYLILIRSCTYALPYIFSVVLAWF